MQVLAGLERCSFCLPLQVSLSDTKHLRMMVQQTWNHKLFPRGLGVWQTIIVWQSFSDGLFSNGPFGHSSEGRK